MVEKALGKPGAFFCYGPAQHRCAAKPRSVSCGPTSFHPQDAMAETQKKKRWWQSLFPSYAPIEQANLNGLSLPPGGGIYENFTQDGTQLGGVSESAEDGEVELYALPKNRLAKYAVFRTMATDPTIDSALKMHLSHALSARQDTGEIITIESTGNDKDPIVKDLRSSLQHLFNANLHQWGYKAARDGIHFARVYGSPGKGVELIRSDYYTQPQFINVYEQGGATCGYVSAHQLPEKGGLNLIEPWKIVPFKVPFWQEQEVEPMRVDASPFDMANDDFRAEAIAESQNYGTSLLETAYLPWMDLNNAILSLNMSRKNASRLERLIGVNTGKLSPQTAANYLNIVAQQMKNVDQANAQRSLRRGFIQTVINHLIPIFGDGRARLDISTVEGMPNIEAIADIMFHVARLGGSLGVDPSLMGFGEQMSGGLGDGGFFRISVLAAIKAQLIRTAMLNGMQQICDIHIAYKHRKVYLPGEKPYRIVFNSVSTALEREEMENREGRIALATGMAQLVGLIDQEWSRVDRPAFFNFTFTDILKVDEEKTSIMFPADKAKEADEMDKKKAQADLEQPEPPGLEKPEIKTDVMESASPEIKNYIDSLYS